MNKDEQITVANNYRRTQSISYEIAVGVLFVTVTYTAMVYLGVHRDGCLWFFKMLQ